MALPALLAPMAASGLSSLFEKGVGTVAPSILSGIGGLVMPQATASANPYSNAFLNQYQGNGQPDQAGFDPFSYVPNGTVSNPMAGVTGTGGEDATYGAESQGYNPDPQFRADGSAIPVMEHTSTPGVYRVNGQLVDGFLNPIGGTANGDTTFNVANGNAVTAAAPSFSPSNPYAPVDLSGFTNSLFGTQTVTAPGSSDLFGVPGGGGFTPFVPDTMGLSSYQAKSFMSAADLFTKQASEYDISPLVTAGKQSFDLARTRLTDARQKALGDIQFGLERSKIAGSSLASDTIASANAEFAKQEADLAVKEAQFNAQAKLQELSARSDLLTKAADARTQAYTAQIDTVLKTATLGAQNAQVQAGLIDSANKLKGTLAALQQDTMKTRMQIMAQEAESIRNNLTQTTIANIGADSAKNNAATQIEIANKQLAQDKAQGVGGLVGSVLTPALTRVGSQIGDYLFGTKPTTADYTAANLFGIGLPASKTGIFG